jgi:hypothetical protein
MHRAATLWAWAEWFCTAQTVFGRGAQALPTDRQRCWLLWTQKCSDCNKTCTGMIYGCDYRRDLDWWMDLPNTYTHHSELQVITAPPLISTLYKSPLHPLTLFPACCVFISRSLPAASNRGDSSASRAQVLSSQPPVQNSTLNIVNWQLPGWRPFHTYLLVPSSKVYFQLSTEIGYPSSLPFNSSARTA